MSDVPLGVFLSGGLDSSALAAMVARVGEVADPDIRGRLRGSRGQRARLRAARGQVRSAPSIARSSSSPSEYFDALPNLVWHEDEPIAFPSSVPLYFVARLAQRSRQGRPDRRRRRRALPRLQPVSRDAVECAARTAVLGAHAQERATRRPPPRRRIAAARPAVRRPQLHGPRTRHPGSVSRELCRVPGVAAARTPVASRAGRSSRPVRRRDALLRRRVGRHARPHEPCGSADLSASNC